MPSYPQNFRHSFPERGSIRATILANSTRRLYTHPLEWTAEQLEHMSLELNPLEREHAIVADSIPALPLLRGIQWNDIHGAVADIQGCRKKRERDMQMRSLVAKLSTASTGVQLQSGYLEFRYAGRPVAKIHLPLIYNQQTTLGPAWAYVDRTWSSKQRHEFHYLRKRSFSYATRAIQEADSLLLDPLHVAILIALAQKARGARLTSVSKASHKVSLFVTEHRAGTSSVDNHGCSRRRPQPFVTTLKQYTATFTDEYLQKFDDPYHYHSGTLHIHHEALSLALPSTIYQALERASTEHDRSWAKSTVSKKRKALGSIPGMVKNVQRSILDVNKKRG